MDKCAILGMPDVGASSILSSIKDAIRSKLLGLSSEERKKNWMNIMNQSAIPAIPQVNVPEIGLEI